VLASSGLLANRVLACGELAWTDWDESDAPATDPAVTAALNPPVIGSINSSSDNKPNAGPVRNGGIAPAEEAIVGIASFYDDPQRTASGEPYDPNAFTAAAQLKIRDKFGGIRFGVKYQPAFAVAEYENKKLIIKVNDVGPLRPGRKFDLSRAAMAYFGGLEKGLLQEFKVTPLPLGQTYVAGPVTDVELAALGIGDGGADLAMAQAQAPDTQEMPILDAGITIPLPEPLRETTPTADNGSQPETEEG
jgi:rare lipoprotein A